jgi:hypothetical protein
LALIHDLEVADRDGFVGPVERMRKRQDQPVEGVQHAIDHLDGHPPGELASAQRRSNRTGDYQQNTVDGGFLELVRHRVGDLLAVEQCPEVGSAAGGMSAACR